MDNLGEIIRQARKEQSVSFAKIAKGICDRRMLAKYENLECYPTKMVGIALLQRLGVDTLETEIIYGADEKYCYESRLVRQLNELKKINRAEECSNNVLNDLFKISKEKTIEECWKNLDNELFTDVELKIIILYISNSIDLTKISENNINSLIKKLESIIERKRITKNQVIMCVDYLIEIYQYIFEKNHEKKVIKNLKKIQGCISKKDIFYLKLDMYIKKFKLEFSENQQSLKKIEICEVMREIENAGI
ncbi:hypothetical protein [Lachnobacterium bovis]|uniref:HTH cro/C1-type domain-containing protein n=3 Tax=Lachnobacterium bovis TaxID=140626 RepID=A0A1H3L3C0_9FIRM|nr:hypothetical protein [Lachnobacterium bovis]SDY58901.1 hypothetical protein SAMN02910414_01902 [Lachnobacterium bovis DSM 14045]SER78579.1 hypothetical protein SAMN02910429_01082 [Lachnobacterium bovis]SFG19607.1 hypothetical protein SAMN04487761_10784 [Lachnospiraceae bacterium C7]